MLISENISLDVDTVLQEMYERQGLPWNSGRINDYYQFNTLNKLFIIVNSGIPQEDFMYQGDLYRIHTPYDTSLECVDLSKETIIGKVYEDGSCMVLPQTEFTDEIVAFSKSYDFTRPVFYKVGHSRKAVFLHVNTGQMFGIDVNRFYQHFGVSNEHLTEEREVLFPLNRKTLVKEYWCTPNRFKYYMRNAVEA